MKKLFLNLLFALFISSVNAQTATNFVSSQYAILGKYNKFTKERGKDVISDITTYIAITDETVKFFVQTKDGKSVNQVLNFVSTEPEITKNGTSSLEAYKCVMKDTNDPVDVTFLYESAKLVNIGLVDKNNHIVFLKVQKL